LTIEYYVPETGIVIKKIEMMKILRKLKEQLKTDAPFP
jgi:hypothetical protein